MLRKDDVIWMLLEALAKKNGQSGNAASAPAPAEPVYGGLAGKYSPIGRKMAAAPAFDWEAEEEVGYDPEKYYGRYGEEQQADYGWQPDEGYGYCRKEKHPHCEEPKEKCRCHDPWVEEKWICTKEARICCEKIPCEKKKKDHGCGPYGY